MMIRILTAALFALAAGAAVAQTGGGSASDQGGDRAAAETVRDLRRGDSDAPPAPPVAPERKVRVIVPSPYASSAD